MANVMKYYNGTTWIPVASQYIDPNYAYLKEYDNPSNRNLLYNGAMQVAQRGTSATGLGNVSDYYTADRWKLANSTGTIVWTQTVEADGPTGSGLTKSVKMLCTTSKASLAAGDVTLFHQKLEGQDLQRIAKGTASAQQLSLSFWVKSNVSGTAVVYFYDQTNARLVAASYTTAGAGAWEKKTLLIPADSTGTIPNTNAAGLEVSFLLVAGSNFQSGSLPTTWGAVGSNYGVGQTNYAAATNNYWQITGVQLEVGPVATSFEFKSYGQELRECQRYYQRTDVGPTGRVVATNDAEFAVVLSPAMRVSPTSATLISGSGIAWFPGVNTYSFTGVSILGLASSVSGVGIKLTGGTSLPVIGTVLHIATNGIGLSAEL
jgi:hypothetical protein